MGGGRLLKCVVCVVADKRETFRKEFDRLRERASVGIGPFEAACRGREGICGRLREVGSGTGCVWH